MARRQAGKRSAKLLVYIAINKFECDSNSAIKSNNSQPLIDQFNQCFQIEI